MNKVSVLKSHIEFKKTSVKNWNKLKDTERYLDMFLNSTSKPLSKFNDSTIVDFLNSLNYSIRTINDLKCLIKVFIKWHFQDWSSRFRNLDRICRMKKAPRTYEPEQMLKIEEIEKLVKGEKDLMWKVYWLVFFYGGFRPSECARLLWQQIYFEPEGVIIKIKTTKTSKDFYKSLPKQAEHLLKEWKRFNDSKFVFPSPVREGHCIVAETIRRKLKRLSKRVLGKEVVPYCLRHSIATILYNDDSRKDDETANQLGHTKSMKETYMNLNEDSLKANARKIWIKTKPLPPAVREELQQELDNVKTSMEEMQKKMVTYFTKQKLERNKFFAKMKKK